MITMGLDASTTKTGYSIFNDNRLVKYGCIKAKKNFAWRERIALLGVELEKLIKENNVGRIVVEDVPLIGGKNRPIQTAVMLGAVQGMIITIGNQTNVPIIYKAPSQWRSPIGLYDGTKVGTRRDVMKQKSVEMANKLFHLDLVWVSPQSTKNEHDVSDAILVAYSELKQDEE